MKPKCGNSGYLSSVSLGDGAAGESHLHAGRPIYYCDDDFVDEVVRKWPDGRKDLVFVGHTGEILTSRPWPASRRVRSSVFRNISQVY